MESLPFPVDVFFNLHRREWSLRNRKTGLVERHSRVVAFAFGASFVVQPAGRARVLATGHKTVHAFVRGDEAEIGPDFAGWLRFGSGLPDACRVTYNPRKAGHFTRLEKGERIDAASAVVMIAPPGEAPQVWAVPKM